MGTETVEQTLDQIFDAPNESNAPEGVPPVEPAPMGEPPAAEMPPEPAPPAEPVEDEPSSADESLTVPVAALKDERKKRQEIERQLAELQAQAVPQQPQPVSQPQQPQQQQPPQMPDPLEDPEGWKQWHDETQARLVHQQQVSAYQTRALTSRMVAMQQHDDYEVAEEAFTAAARTSPELLRQIAVHPNPAQYAYEVGKRAMMLQEIGPDPQAYIEQEVARRLAEQGQPAPQPNPVESAPVPQSLASTASAQPRNSKGQFEEAALDELLPD
jgi:hypothetical protein